MSAQQGLDAPDRNRKPKSFSKLLACFGDMNALGSAKSSVFGSPVSEPGQGQLRGKPAGKNLSSQSTARATRTQQLQIKAKATQPPAPPIPYYVHSVETVQTAVVPLGSIQAGPRLLPTTTIRYEMKMSSVAAWPSTNRECGLDDVSSSGASSLSGELHQQRCLGDSKTCSSDLKYSSEQSSQHTRHPSENGDSDETQPRQPKGSRITRILNKLKNQFQNPAPAAPTHAWRLVAHGMIQHLPAQGPALTRSQLAAVASVAGAPAVMEPSANLLAPSSSPSDPPEDLVSCRPGLSLPTVIETMVHPTSPKTPQATSIPPPDNLSPTLTSPAALQTLPLAEPEEELVREATTTDADPSTPPTAIVSPWVTAPPLALTAASGLPTAPDLPSRALASPFALCAASSPTSPTAARGLATTSLSLTPLSDSLTADDETFADAEASQPQAADAGMVERLNTPDISEDLPEQLFKPEQEITPLDLAWTAYCEKPTVGGAMLMVAAASVLPSVDIHTPSPPTTPRSAAKPSAVHILPLFKHDAKSVALARLSMAPGTAVPPVGSTLSLRDLIVAEPYDASAMVKATDGWERDLPDSSAGLPMQSPMQWSASSVTDFDPAVEVETPRSSVDSSLVLLPEPADAAPHSLHLQSAPPASASAGDLSDTIIEPSRSVTEASPPARQSRSPVIRSKSTAVAHWVNTSSGLWEPAHCVLQPLGRAASDRCFTIAIDGGFFRRNYASPPAPSTPVPSSSMDLPRTRPSADAGAATGDSKDDGAANPSPNATAPSTPLSPTTPTYLPANSAFYTMASTPAADADNVESEVTISGAVAPTEVADSPIRRVPSFGEALGSAAPAAAAAVIPADNGADTSVYSSAFWFPRSFAFIPSNSSSDDEGEVDIIQLPMLSTAFLEPCSFAVSAPSEPGSDNESELSLAPVPDAAPRETVQSYALSIGSQSGSDSDDDDRS